ncbi:dihydrodipicolinate reductase C-terminal domain-containing protein [Clostridium sp. 'White wine YQ']|uniref:dihydrodipicolinate reductase C-terminal domain-containing protein n=1 Tax=Clostridium sp. 'White wine YQ' TaxID=3027474 RepID=UPI0023665F31|nr:dihydrodipicolinate reductase C-terminal domain-containing protein [Clostridium sp. 'White wine YQ']MDD7794194.1 dihydrodipicolinate reductase C-terminal domain-containing protein [Clostridium sp. 'White wine YQ']
MRIGMIGFGEIGQEIGRYICENKELELVSVMCSKNSEKIGVVVDSINNLERNIKNTKLDVIIDFSDSRAIIRNAELISRMKVNLVIGTTGFNELEIEKLVKFSKIYNNGIVYAPNITIGVNDMIEISHKSITRNEFVEGVIKATKFINGKIGFYEMKDVINLEKVINNYIEDNYISAVN